MLYEADFHKPGIYGGGRVWANEWDVVFRAPSRGGRGRRAAAAFVVCFRWGEFFLEFFFSIFFLLQTHTACCKYEAFASCLIYLSTSSSIYLVNSPTLSYVVLRTIYFILVYTYVYITLAWCENMVCKTRWNTWY